MPAPSRPLTQLLGTTTFRLASGIVALFVVSAAVIVWLLHAQTNAALTDQVLVGLQTEADSLAALSRDGGAAALERAVAARSIAHASQLYALTDIDGVQLAGNIAGVPPEIRDAAGGGVFRYRPLGATEAATRLAVAIPVEAGSQRRLVVGRDIEDQRVFAERVRRIFLYGFGGLALVGLAGGLLMSRIVVGRIDEINAAAHAIMAGNLDRRIEARGTGDEIDGLAENLNAMLDRIEQLMGGLREVSDNIAHDLKTPLTRLRSRAEAALRGNGGDEGYRGGLERILEEADELIKTFNALLLIARLEAGSIDENMEAFDLSELVRDVSELYEPVADEAGLALDVGAGGGPRIRANRQLIGQAVANLIDNAIKYGSASGAREPDTATIGVRVAEVADGVEISVADRGPGIAPEDRARALKRFVRLERSRTRPGTGLGLSLVAAVTRIHGGAVRLSDTTDRTSAPGLKVVVWLPKRLYCE